MLMLLRFLQAIFWLVFLLPPAIALNTMYFCGDIIYQIACLTKIKRAVARNFGLFFPQADTTLLADKILRNTSYSIMEVLCTPFFREPHFNLICKFIGTENLDLALVKRKGAFLITMHTGNYELVPAAISNRGYKLTSILKATKDPLFVFLRPSREHKGTKIINVLEDNMYRETLRALGNNRIVGILIDTGALESRHEMFGFLGKKVPVATGWLTVAQRSEAPVIPVLCKREGKKVVISFGESLTVTRDNRDEIMRKIGQHFENFIRNHPEQWLMFLNENETKRMLEGK